MRFTRFKKGIAILLALLLLPAAAALAGGEEAEAPAETVEAPEETAGTQEETAGTSEETAETPEEIIEAPIAEDPFAPPVTTEEADETEAPEEFPEVPIAEDPFAPPVTAEEADETGEPAMPDEEPEREISEEELEGLQEATFNFSFQVDTIWENYGDCMFIAVRNAATMIAAVNTIDSLGEGSYIIALASDIVLPASDVTLLRFTCGDTTILGCGHTIRFQPVDGGEPCVTVEGAATAVSLGSDLIEDSLTLVGGKPEADEDLPSLIAVRGGTLSLYDGAVLEKHEAGHGIGGAVSVESGLFRMVGGRIRGCGVVGYGSVYGGGVGVAWGGSFYMFGGEISDCYAVSIDGEAYGGGVAGVYVRRDEAPVYEKAMLQLQGGVISGCRSDRGGGAAFCELPCAVLIGGAEIRENIACGADESSGAGVWCREADGFALYVYDSCVISDNTWYGSAAYTTGFEPAEEPESAEDEPDEEEASEEPAVPVRGDEAFRLTDDADLLAVTSDLCVGEDFLRVGLLKTGAFVSLADGGEVLLPEVLPTSGAAAQIEALKLIRSDRSDRVQ